MRVHTFTKHVIEVELFVCVLARDDWLGSFDMLLFGHIRLLSLPNIISVSDCVINVVLVVGVFSKAVMPSHVSAVKSILHINSCNPFE